VKVFGGEVRQLQVQIKPDRLLAYNISVQDVSSAATAATGVRGAGFVETAAQRLVLQTEGQSLTAEQLGEIVVTQREGRSIRLRDVANVVEAGEPKFGDSIINGKPGVLMTTASQYGANTMEVTRGVEDALSALKPVFASMGIEYTPALHRPATFIEIAIKNMKTSLLLGAVLVAIVLFLFLLDLRTALISFTAIPLSLLAAVVVLDRMGVTLNTMTLGGLAAVLGVVVDDAIITVENILRRLREKSDAHPAAAAVPCGAGCHARSTELRGLCDLRRGDGVCPRADHERVARALFHAAGRRFHPRQPRIAACGVDGDACAVFRAALTLKTSRGTGLSPPAEIFS